ncbi:GntR family transcriptional regulator [Friedmanniella endophytica]|uniref:GntR family transcriptional regulator n=1 Tax=Microlunatus kandeliicorticis TaxID=1759536 RepID=A0A7W3IRB2_9ACTN|nr:GntR family transcriptional regulator [Microlunatus kandeliicorticis]MBA8793794.1 GntR family transcriptional regulator [Microlunatus kandeliicorticis]
MSERSDSKHETIREQLRAEVLALSPGERLPPERHLATRLGVARMTVRQAIGGLVREGIVTPVHGKGNLRSADPMRLRVQLWSFTETVRAQGLTPSTQPLEWDDDPEPPPAAVEFFAARPGGGPAPRTLRRSRRLRLGDGTPLALEEAWFSADRVPPLTEEVLAGSLYALLREAGVLPDSGEESVTVGLPTEEEAKLLAIAGTRPLLRLTRRAFAGGEPVEYAQAALPGDRFELAFPLIRDPS